MRLLLLMPDAHMHKLRIGNIRRSLREAPLTLTTLAALTPADPDIEQTLVDGSIDDIPLDHPADLVAISVLTGCARPAYALAAHYRRRGIPVVLGGVHVTILPGEALQHADAIVIGRGEDAWPRLLRDLRAGHLRRVYRETPLPGHELPGVPPPRRDLQRDNGYMLPNTVHATRGCLRSCDFCTVSAVWPRYLKRPLADVVRDIRAIPGRYFSFNDVSLIDDDAYARELLTAITPLRKRWGGLVTSDSLARPGMLELMARSGCRFLLVGFETLHQATLKTIHKNFNKVAAYKNLVHAMQAHGITVQGTFVFGFDEDTPATFADTVDYVRDLRVDIPRYSIYTPYPGTPLFRRLDAEHRILSYNWDDYDTMHVVIRPRRMTPDELYTGFKWAYRETFRLGHIARRITRPDIRTAINLVGNLAYRIFVKRLYNEPRFATPHTLADTGTRPPPEHWQVPPDLEDQPALPPKAGNQELKIKN
jgi:radical SAM superfamily enzyme YgiQ (UPF0313 family)